MPKFRKKPVVIEARQYVDGNDVRELLEWINYDYGAPLTFNAWVDGSAIKIPTLEGVMDATPGDWIIKGVNGEFYPCKPDIFEMTYEEVAGNE